MRARTTRWLLLACLLTWPVLAGAAADPIVFTSPPTDLANVAGIVPLGNTNPGGDHVLPVDHMYLEYPNPDNGGADAYPVYAMADGEVVFVQRVQDPERAHPDYQIFIRHGRSLTSYYDHVHELSAALQAAIDAAPGDPWLRPPGTPFELLFLGQKGALAAFPVQAGEQVATTRSYSSTWDVGVVDTKVKQRVAGSKKRRYPDLRTKLRAFGLKVKSAWKGHEVINGACFLDYLAPGLRASWQALLVSTPQTCGSHVWDRKGTLQGAWFHPELGKTDFFELERGALAIGPDNLAPATSLQISIGSGSSYSALDPTGALPRLDRAFRVDFDSSPGARVNPDPAQVTAATGSVCYDLAYDEGAGPRYNVLRLHLVSSKRLAIDFDATPALAAACAAAPLGEPDASWTATYVR